jgi:hypothetical protein
MKKPTRRTEKQNRSRVRHGNDQKQTETEAEERAVITDGDLMWGDEGIDDPPLQSTARAMARADGPRFSMPSHARPRTDAVGRRRACVVEQT